MLYAEAYVVMSYDGRFALRNRHLSKGQWSRPGNLLNAQKFPTLHLALQKARMMQGTAYLRRIRISMVEE